MWIYPTCISTKYRIPKLAAYCITTPKTPDLIDIIQQQTHLSLLSLLNLTNKLLFFPHLHKSTTTQTKMHPPPLSTPLTSLLGIRHPIMLAGMDQVAGAELAAAVTNAGGFGTLGGARYSPKMLREMIGEMKALLKDKNGKFGVDLLLPQVGGGARRTNVSFQFSFLILGSGVRGIWVGWMDWSLKD